MGRVQGLKAIRQMKGSFSRSGGVQTMKDIFSRGTGYVGRDLRCRVTVSQQCTGADWVLWEADVKMELGVQKAF